MHREAGREKESTSEPGGGAAERSRQAWDADCFIESLLHAHLFLSWSSFQFWLSDVTNGCISNRLQLSVAGAWWERVPGSPSSAPLLTFKAPFGRGLQMLSCSACVSSSLEKRSHSLTGEERVHAAVSHCCWKAEGCLSVEQRDVQSCVGRKVCSSNDDITTSALEHEGQETLIPSSNGSRGKTQPFLISL